MADIKGITARKEEEFSEWYTQVIQKAELIEYTKVSGAIVFRPRSYAIWEKIQDYFDKLIKKSGVQNAYFPLFIPESLLMKEEEHVEGFSPEVAWVTHAGDNELNERLAVRPTSETIMYDSYSKWIRSYRDLPLRLNQWCNVVRWEFKHAVPFLRTREFLWQEGHTVFATKEEAETESLEILEYYAQVYEDLLAIPVIKGRKSEKEKFAGADYSLSVELFLPTGKGLQGATSHHLGQNFAKAFDIKFTNENEQEQLPYQNSWGITTRTIGAMIIMHSDDKGLILPPKVAEEKIVIVPILFADSKDKVLARANEIKEMLSAYLDDREDYSPGWKFNEWEMKGVPLRIEFGPKDMEHDQVVVVRRDNNEKKIIKIEDLKEELPKILDDIQKNLYEKAKNFMKKSIKKVSNKEEFLKVISNKEFPKAIWCGSKECEEIIKDESGAKSICIPLDQEPIEGKCFFCGKEAKEQAIFGKCY